jgi:hypothetical protein
MKLKNEAYAAQQMGHFGKKKITAAVAIFIALIFLGIDFDSFEHVHIGFGLFSIVYEFKN